MSCKLIFGMYFYLYLKWKLGYRIHNLWWLMVSAITLHFTAFHLHFTAGIYFFMQFFILLNSFCFLPLQDGNKECLSDVDDLGNWHKKCLWRGLWETFLGRISWILQSKNAKNVWIECQSCTFRIFLMQYVNCQWVHRRYVLFKLNFYPATHFKSSGVDQCYHWFNFYFTLF